MVEWLHQGKGWVIHNWRVVRTCVGILKGSMEWVLGCLCKFWFYLYNYNCDLYMFDEPIIIVFCKFWFYLVLSVNPKIEFFLLLINVNYILNNIFFNCLFYTNCCLCSISFDDDDQHDIYCNNKSNKLKKVVKLVPSSNFFWYNCDMLLGKIFVSF